MNEQDKERIRLLVIEKLKDDADLFDVEAEMDSSLSFEENKNIILDKIENFNPIRHYDMEAKMMENLSKVKPTGDNFLDDITKNVRVAVVYGDTGSGKTALVFKLLQSFKNKRVFFYNHPKADLIKALGYENMKSISELSRITDSVIYFDEPQLSFNRYEKTNNDFFLLLCSLARQNDITLIFATSDTRWVNKGLESYVSHWFIKDLDMTLVKQGSISKRIVKNIMPLAMNELNLQVDEFLFYSKKDSVYNGLHTFKKPIYFNDQLSKAYKHTNVVKQTAKELLK